MKSALKLRARFSRGPWSLVLVALGVLGLLGCKDPSPHLPERLLEPLALDAQLVMIDAASDHGFVLDVAGASPGATRKVDLPHGTLSHVRRNGHDEVLILALGRRAEEDHEAEPGVLSVLGADGGLRRYEVGNPFDLVAQSDDGNHALLFKSGSSLRLLDNPNEVAIVDLTRPPEDAGAVTALTLRSFGDSPTQVFFSPDMTIAGETRRLAVVLSPSNVTLVDLSHLDRRETTVQLSSPGGGAVEPHDVVFHPTEPEIYVRASSNDVFVFNLRERPAGDDPAAGGKPHNDFRPFIDQLGVPGEPSDMKLYQSDAGTRLLVVSANSQVVSSVDSATSQVSSVELPGYASDALVFEAASPRDVTARPRALLYRPGYNTLFFLDLADLEARGSRNLERLDLDRPVARVLPMPGEQQVLVLHDGNGVSLIDLAARTVSLITSIAALQDARFDENLRTLWFGPAFQPYVGMLALETGETSEILLDAEIKQVVPLFGAHRVAIVHPASEGHITLIDTENPTPEHTRTLRGFFE
jgi:hypothetical protein